MFEKSLLILLEKFNQIINLKSPFGIMKNKFLSITGVSALSKAQQKEVTGGAFFVEDRDIRKCGCDCAARVTGPKYCRELIACPAVYTCDQHI